MSSPAIILSLWLFSYSLFFVILPDELRWLYIFLFPSLIVSNLWQAWREKRLKISLNPFEWLLLVYVVYVAYSLYTTDALPLPKEVYGVEFLFRIVQPILLFVYLRLKKFSKLEWQLFSYALCLLVLIQAFFGVISLIFPEAMPFAYQPRPAHLYTRATGTMVSPEAYVLTLLFALAMMFYQSLQNGGERKVLLVGMALATISIAIAGNRTGWVCLGILLLYIMAVDRRLIKWILGFVAIAVLSVVILFPNFLQQSLFRLMEWRQVESRITMLSAGLDMAIEKPLFGWGYATYDLYDWQHMGLIGQIQPTNYELASATSHNGYVTILAETGIIGFVLYMLPTLYYYIRSLLAWRNFEDKAYLGILWMIIFLVHLANQTADLRFFPFVLGFWWFALALIANSLETEQ
jgi:O-antigen ligase